MSMLKDWTDIHTQQFQKEIMTFNHGLNETGLFTDEALIELLEKHPSDYLDVCTMGDSDHPEYPNKLRTGDFRDCSGKTLLDAAKAGRVWMNLRKAMNLHTEYKQVLDDMYGSLSEKTGAKAFNPNGGILISSPISQTPYHFDKTEVILWHVRGAKRVLVYPRTQDFIPDAAFERALTNRIEDDLPYTSDMDKHATIIDLEDGQAATWPLNSPHRVDNSAFCVSVTTEYSTRESALKNAAMIANATLRNKFGMEPSYEMDSQTSRYVKSMLGRVMKKTGVASDTTTKDLVTFKIDPEVPGFVVDTDPFERNF